MDLNQLHKGVRDSLWNDQNFEEKPQPAGQPTTRDTAEQERRATASRIRSLATAGHHTAGDLEQHFPHAARHIHEAAGGFEHISNLLRDPHLDEIAVLIGKLRRKQPAAIMAGIVLVSLGVVWFLNSSSDASGRSDPACNCEIAS